MTLETFLSEIERLDAAATKRPWRADWEGTNHFEVTSSGAPYWLLSPDGNDATGPDLDFIAHARTALPLAARLLRAVDVYLPAISIAAPDIYQKLRDELSTELAAMKGGKDDA